MSTHDILISSHKKTSYKSAFNHEINHYLRNLFVVSVPILPTFFVYKSFMFMSSYNQMKKKNVLVQSLHGYLGITLSQYLVFLDHKGFLAHA